MFGLRLSPEVDIALWEHSLSPLGQRRPWWSVSATKGAHCFRLPVPYATGNDQWGRKGTACYVEGLPRNSFNHKPYKMDTCYTTDIDWLCLADWNVWNDMTNLRITMLHVLVCVHKVNPPCFDSLPCATEWIAETKSANNLIFWVAFLPNIFLLCEQKANVYDDFPVKSQIAKWWNKRLFQTTCAPKTQTYLYPYKFVLHFGYAINILSNNMSWWYRKMIGADGSLERVMPGNNKIHLLVGISYLPRLQLTFGKVC